MHARRPIFFSLISGLVAFLRDTLYKALLEPSSPARRRLKRWRAKKK